MFKKITLISAVIISSLSFTAHASPYLGANIGINTNTTSNSGNGNPGNFRGIPFGLVVGYDSMISDNFYLAGELEGTLGTAEISNNNNLKSTYGYGASVMPGVMLSDYTITYLRLGLVKSHFSSGSENVTGGRVGLGLETSLTQNIYLRGEYDYTGYRSFTGRAGTTVNSPRSDMFRAHFIYKFE